MQAFQVQLAAMVQYNRCSLQLMSHCLSNSNSTHINTNTNTGTGTGTGY
jgi:hypothetical protein